jgi:hypothetical protein
MKTMLSKQPRPVAIAAVALAQIVKLTMHVDGEENDDDQRFERPA